MNSNAWSHSVARCLRQEKGRRGRLGQRRYSAANYPPGRKFVGHLLYNPNTERTEKKLVQGIEQLAEAVGLTEHLPPELHKTLEALFSYRNKMFHGGFEWPLEECGRFTERIENENWHGWFSFAKHGDEPFIVYMTDAFITHCLDSVRHLLNGFGADCKVHIPVNVIETEVMPSTK